MKGNMNTHTHTPGPWFILGLSVSTIADKNGAVVAELPALKAQAEIMDQAARIANARLIAAAPDLLAALSGLVDVQPESETLEHDLNGCDGCALCSARQAIAKAKGEA